MVTQKVESGPTKFVCAVCDKAHPLVVEGRNAYTGAANGNKVCFGCTNKADQESIDKGVGITLTLVWDNNQWLAVNQTGKLRFALAALRPGMTAAQMLGSPVFEHNGKRWRGRFYPQSGTAFFTRIKEPARGAANARARPSGATAAPTAGGNNLTRRPAAKSKRPAKKPGMATAGA